MIQITEFISISETELEFTYARSGGPGGQNVNKVNSKAVLRFPISTSPSIPEGVRMRFINKFGSRLTEDGFLIIASQRFRDQKRNVEDCLAKLTSMIEEVAKPPVPRRATKPSKSSKIKRLDSKSVHSNKKQGRQRPSVDY